MADYLAEVQRI
jgi:hypothetical protein